MKDGNDAPRDELRRRTLLALLGGAAAAVGPPVRGQTGLPACIIAPRQSEGPYFLDKRLRRSDIRADSGGARSDGVPLSLQLRVLNAQTDCSPLVGVAVEIWHCNAAGVYSGVRDRYSGDAGGDFLRGYQVTAADGIVRFLTIYPGWYPGRAVHIHLKLRWPDGDAQGRGKEWRGKEWTSQLYFDDRITDRVHAHPAYDRSGKRRPRNQDDLLFRHGGRELMLALAEAGDGYVASFDLGVRDS